MIRHRRAYAVCPVVPDADGETHFAEAEVDLPSTAFAPPALPFNVSAPIAAAQFVFVTLRVGWIGDWHPAPRVQYWLQFTGQVEVGVSDGETRRFGPGEVVLLEDVDCKGHSTRVIGDVEVRAAFVQV